MAKVELRGYAHRKIWPNVQRGGDLAGTAASGRRSLPIRFVVELHAARSFFRISPRISAVAAGMFVPGP